jgi:hypothetical protein
VKKRRFVAYLSSLAGQRQGHVEESTIESASGHTHPPMRRLSSLGDGGLINLQRFTPATLSGQGGGEGGVG